MFSKVLSVLISLVILSIYWKTRLTPYPEDADLTIASMLAVLVWIVINPLTSLRAIAESVGARWKSVAFWFVHLLAIYPAIHYLAFGGDLMKTARFLGFPASLMVIAYHLIPLVRIKEILISIMIGFGAFSILAIIDMNVAGNALRLYSLGSSLQLGQAAGFGILFTVLWGAYNRQYRICAAGLTLFALAMVLSGAKAPWIGVPIAASAAVVLLARSRDFRLFARASGGVIGMISLLALCVFTPLVPTISSVSYFTSEAGLKSLATAATDAAPVDAPATVGGFGVVPDQLATFDPANGSIDRLRAAASGELGKGSAGARQILWREAVSVAVANPLGIGFGKLASHYAEVFAGTPEAKMVYPHNVFLEAWAELGVVGVLILISAVATAAWGWVLAAWRDYHNQWVVIGAASMAFWGFQSLVTGDLNSHMFFFVLIGVGASIAPHKLRH